MNTLARLLVTELNLQQDSDGQINSTNPSVADQQLPSVAVLTQAISKLQNHISEKDVAETLIILSNGKPWDGVLVGSALKSASNLSGINWDNVLLLLEESISLDDTVYDLKLGPQPLVDMLITFSTINDTLVPKLYSRTWNNSGLQLELALSSFYIRPNQFNFQEHGLEPLFTAKIFMNASESIRIRASNLLYHPFNIANIVHYFLDSVSKENGQGNATAFLDGHGKEFPELFFFGSLTMPRPHHPIIVRVIDNLFDLALLRHINSDLIFYSFPFFDKNWLVTRLFDVYNKEPLNIQYVFEAAKSASVIPDLLAIDHPAFTLEIAATADKHNLISFSGFLKSKLDSGGDAFAGALIEFLELKASLEYSQNQGNISPPGLSLRTVSTAIQLLNSTNLTGVRAEQYKSVQIQCLQSYPRLINFGFTQEHDKIILSHVESNTFDSNIELEMKMHYQRMYEQQIEIRDIITMLQRLKQSRDPREQDVFACMVHSLFDEYRFFPEYPLNALATTAVLFGSLIYFQLIDGTALSIALRFILDSLRQPADSNMFKFGLQALVEFRERLSEFPKYCHRLLEIPGLRVHPNFFQQIKDIVSVPSGPMIGNGENGDEENSGFMSISYKIHIPNEVLQEDPSDQTKENVMFAVNNLAPDNLRDKASKITDVLDDKYLQWFASYIVGQRAKQEPNYHKLYIDLISVLNYTHLESYVFQVTYYEIARIANDPDVVESMDKRKFLRNLGQLLGSISLERNKPILHKNISFKMLLCEAFSQGKLRAIIPFVCKILDRTSKSAVFTPENPWVHGILKVLVELYQFVDLALPNKFEIEVLFKELHLEMKDVEPSFIIRNYLAQNGVQSQGTQLSSGGPIQDISVSTEPRPIVPLASSQPVLPSVPPAEDLSIVAAGSAQNINQQEFKAQQLQLQLQQPIQQPKIPQPLIPVFSLDPYLRTAAQLEVLGSSHFAQHAGMKELFHLAVESVTKETLALIVERSVAIATISARSLLLKDFAYESDESQLRIAAHNIVKNLAGNLALASAKDLVKDSLVSTLRNLLITRGAYSDNNYPADQINMAVNDNLESICKVIEQGTVDRAIGKMDELLYDDYQARRQHRESGSTQPFSSQVDQYALQLPEPFKLKPGGLDPQQFAIYANFGASRPIPDSILSAPENIQSQQIQVQPPIEQQLLLQGDQALGQLSDPQSSDPIGQQLTQASGLESDAGFTPIPFAADFNDRQAVEQALERALAQIQSDIKTIIKLAGASSSTSLAKLPNDDPILTTFSAIASTIATTVQTFRVGEIFIEKLTQFTLDALFTEPLDQLARDVIGLLLVRFCEASPVTGREVVLWLFIADTDKKYNVPSLITVVKCGLITWADFDYYLSKKMDSDELVKFACELIFETVLRSEPFAFRADFAYTLEALEPLTSERPAINEGGESLHPNEHVVELLSKLENYTLAVDGAGPSLKKNMNHIFAEWVHLLNRPAMKQRFLDSFIYQLSKRNILSDDAMVTSLLRTAITTSIKEYNANVTTQAPLPNLSAMNQTIQPYIVIDCLARLLVEIVRNSKGMEKEKRINYVKTLFSVITLMICNDHEVKGETFSERPYFRLILSFLAGFHEVASDDDSIDGIYIALAETLQILQPIAIPGFTFSWMSLISNRYFMPSILSLPEKKGWEPMIKLLVSLLRFESLYAQGKEFPQSIASIYKGTLKIFFAIVNDFPEFILEYHWTLLKYMPPSFVQLRNLILSTFPQSMQLPNPLAQGLKVNRLPEIRQSPLIADDPADDLTTYGLKTLVDKYLEAPNPAIVKGIASGLRLPKPRGESGIGFETVTMDSSIINALVLYIVMDACKQPLEGDSAPTFNRESSHFSLISSVLLELNVEGQYFLCEAMANQLRYPNRHTHFCSCVFLCLFGTNSLGDKKESICHLITRVLLERIISNRPHPWGLVITFTELLRNSTYKFWDLKFTKEYEDIERMFTLLYEHINGGNGSPFSLGGGNSASTNGSGAHESTSAAVTAASPTTDAATSN